MDEKTQLKNEKTQLKLENKKNYDIDNSQKVILLKRLFDKKYFISYYDIKSILEEDTQIFYHFIQRNFKYKYKEDDYVFINNKKKYKKNILYYDLNEIINLVLSKFLKHKTQKLKISKIFKKFLSFFEPFYDYNLPKPKYLRKLWRVWYFFKKKKHKLSSIFGEYLSLKEMKSKKLKDFEKSYSKELNILKELDKDFSHIKTMEDMKRILSCPEYDTKLFNKIELK